MLQKRRKKMKFLQETYRNDDLNILNFQNKLEISFDTETAAFQFPDSPISCDKLFAIAIFFATFFIVSLAQSIFILFVYYKSKKLRSHYDYLIITLTVSNLIGILIDYPIVIASKFKCR